MAQQNRDAVERLQRGLIIALIAIVAILVVVLAVRMLRGGTELLGPLNTQSSATVDGEAAGSVDALLANARSAMSESRLVSPASENAYEYYLGVLDQEPENISAREALNDLYGIAVSSAEQAIGAGDFDDAERLAAMLARSNPESFTVVNLRQRIERGQAADAAAELAREQRDQQAAAGEVAAAAPVETTPEPVPEPASDLASVTSPTTTPPAAPPPAASAAAAGTPTTTTTTTAPATAQPAAPPSVRDARLLSRVDPAYPREAMRNRQQGWVEVEFTIGRDGTVSNAQVVASRPSRLFDRAAVQAIEGWRFEPRQENGQPVPSRLRQRFDFRLD